MSREGFTCDTEAIFKKPLQKQLYWSFQLTLVGKHMGIWAFSHTGVLVATISIQVEQKVANGISIAKALWGKDFPKLCRVSGKSCPNCCLCSCQELALVSKTPFSMKGARSRQEMGPSIVSCFLIRNQRETVIRMVIVVYCNAAQTYANQTQVTHLCALRPNPDPLRLNSNVWMHLMKLAVLAKSMTGMHSGIVVQLKQVPLLHPPTPPQYMHPNHSIPKQAFLACK